MKTIFSMLSLASLLVATTCSAHAQQLKVDPTSLVAPVSPTLYGLMTEEINYSYDGGLYAEMLRNRTFTAPGKGFSLNYWRPVMHGNSLVKLGQGDHGPSAALPKSADVTVTSASPQDLAGLGNEGYWGMGVRPSTVYQGSFYATSDAFDAAQVRLVDDQTGTILAASSVNLAKGDWKPYRFTLKTGGDMKATSAAHFEMLFDHPGQISLQLISLFPPTYHNRPNGNRPDLMEMMAAMHPQFLRFPGGNYVEGNTVEERFNWKETIGPLVGRPTHRSPWGYQSTDGMGLLEFLYWCEDLHMEPVLAVYAGYSLRGEHVTGAALDPHIQDALDEIEFVAGDTKTKWGHLRELLGHPAPFTLHYIEIGNEDFFDKSGSYEERFSRFASAIRAKYPQYKLIATTPVKQSKPDLIDDHYYQSPEEFFNLVHKYDKMDRNGPKIFVGEWATRTGSPTPNFGAALGDAAWMTSLERNSDLILMSCYAPLFTNVNPGGMQWSTDLLGYDALRAYASPAYYAQVLFSNHLGDHTVKTTAANLGSRFFWSATVSKTTKVLHLKLVNASDTVQPLHLDLSGIKDGQVKMYTLHGESRWATNTIEQPDAIHPVETTLPASKLSEHNVAGNTIEVLDVPLI